MGLGGLPACISFRVGIAPGKKTSGSLGNINVAHGSTVFCFFHCSDLHTEAENAPDLLLTTRCATQRSVLAHMRTSVHSSASRGATNTTKTSSTPGYPMRTQMVSLYRVTQRCLSLPEVILKAFEKQYMDK